MKLRAIMYISQEHQSFSTDDLRALLQIAIDRNRQADVTGYLHYESGYFMQYIEGEADALHGIYTLIRRDPRHLIIYEAELDVSKRRFPEWYMHWEEPEDAQTEAAAIADLRRTIEPFQRVVDRQEHDRVLTIYSRMAYVLRGVAVVKSENAELGRMMAMAVHDLRAPLQSIDALLDMYISDVGDRIDPKFADIEKYIRISLARLSFLVDGILDHFNAVGHTNIENVDAAKLVEEIARTTESTAPGSVVMAAGPLPVVRANSSSLWRVLNGLVDNGLKFNAAAEPRLEVSAEWTDAHWQFCVRDNGIGIAPQHQGRIFEIFGRLHSQAAYQGNGIGLATCRKLVEDWGGRIWVSSAEGEGASFYFTVPRPTDGSEADAPKTIAEK